MPKRLLLRKPEALMGRPSHGLDLVDPEAWGDFHAQMMTRHVAGRHKAACLVDMIFSDVYDLAGISPRLGYVLSENISGYKGNKRDHLPGTPVARNRDAFGTHSRALLSAVIAGELLPDETPDDKKVRVRYGFVACRDENEARSIAVYRTLPLSKQAVQLAVIHEDQPRIETPLAVNQGRAEEELFGLVAAFATEAACATD